MFNDSWIYLQHEKRLYSDTVKDFIAFFMDRNAETEKVFVVASIAVWDEHGIHLIQKDKKYTYNDAKSYGFYVPNIPEDHTYVNCILQIKDWKATPISKGWVGNKELRNGRQ